MARSQARTAAMQLIFEKMAGGQGGEETLRMIYEELSAEQTSDASEPTVEEKAWIQAVLLGVLSHLDELDETIAGASKNWAVDRMPKVDLTILRLAAWEIMFEKEVPGPVAINEAVELANTYSDEGSGRFINGVLGTILRQWEGSTEQ